MAETFLGMSEALEYKGEGLRANPCLAVDLAMLGVGTIEECHEALVQVGISSPDGMSVIPDEGIAVQVNDNIVSFGATNMWFNLDTAAEDTIAQYEKSEGAIFAVKLNEEDPEDGGMHLVLLAGQFLNNDEVRSVLVGDSLVDDIQRVNPSEVNARLQRTLDWAGALFSYHVAVSEVADN